jgi:hypothetical protein
MKTDSTSSSSIVIRSYQPSDLPACQELFTEAHRSYDHPMFYINLVLQSAMTDIENNYLQIPNGNWWVAVSTDDNRVVGHVAVLPLHLAEPSYYQELPTISVIKFVNYVEWLLLVIHKEEESEINDFRL